MTDEKLIDINELSTILKVPKKTIYDWSYRGEIPLLKIGKHLRFNLKEVLEFFQAKTGSKSACLPFSRMVDEVVNRSLKISSARPANRKE